MGQQPTCRMVTRTRGHLMVMTMAGAHRALEALNGACEFVREGRTIVNLVVLRGVSHTPQTSRRHNSQRPVRARAYQPVPRV